MTFVRSWTRIICAPDKRDFQGSKPDPLQIRQFCRGSQHPLHGQLAALTTGEINLQKSHDTHSLRKEMRNMFTRLTRWILSLCVLAPAMMLYCQVDTGSIVGTVDDAGGAVISTATVTITQEATNVSAVVHSNASGDYVSPPLRNGIYTVTVAAPGFASQTQSNLTLNVQQRLKVDFKLTVGNVSSKVLVTGAPQAINTQGSSLGEVVSSKMMTQLPLNGRDYYQLAGLSPGIAMTGSGNTNGNDGGTSTAGSPAGQHISFASNGARGTLNNFILDGIDNNSNDDGGPLLTPSVDAIGQFKIQTNSFSAQFGRSGGAVINAVIKSGTNGYHGDVFEFFRNSALDARDYFEDPSAKKASYKLNQFGGTLGGPIIKDKLFWFGDYQGTSVRQPLTFVSSVPTAKTRMGDFSEAGNPVIYDPSTYNPVTQARQPFAGNVIPSGDIDPLAQRMAALYPLPNQPGLRNNYVISPVQPDRTDQGDFRADFDATQTDHAFFRWTQSGRTYLSPTPLPGIANGGGSNSGVGHINTMGAALGETHLFTPTTINVFLVGFNYDNIGRGVPQGGNVTPPTGLQVPGVNYDTVAAGLTIFAPRGYRRTGSPRYAPTLIASQERQVSDSLTLIRGKHTIAMGGEMRWSQYNIFQEPAPNGQFSFTGQFTQNPATGDGGDGLADELLGLPLVSTINSIVKVRNRQYVPSGFLEDNFRFTDNLTLNLGVRYDYFSPIVSENNQQSNFDYTTGKIIVAAQNGNSRGLVNVDHLNFSPRVGFAWNPRGNTVLSAGFGIFWSGQEIKTAAPLQLAYNLPFYYQPTFTSDGINPILTVSSGFPPLNPNNAPFPGVTSLDIRLKTPQYSQWNLSFQQGLPFEIGFELSYAGSKGTHLQSLLDPNQVKVPGPGDIQSRRPYPEFGPFTAIEDRGNSSYNALQLKLQKRPTRGLFFISSLTWGKTMNDLPSVCCSIPYPQNSWDVPAERGPADFDQRLRWSMSGDYLIPFRQNSYGSHKVLDIMFAGWHLGGIYTLASGFPFSPSIGFDPSNTGSQGQLRPNQTANGNLPRSQRKPDHWFNLDDYTIPAPYTYGDAGRNSLIGPDTNSLDGSLRKVFPIRGSQDVEFRAEFFNMFNHPNFAQPDPFIDDGPGAAGVVTSTAGANRQIQFAMKYHF